MKRQLVLAFCAALDMSYTFLLLRSKIKVSKYMPVP